MAKSIFDEVSFLYAKFDQAEREWLNRFDDLARHVQTATIDFTTSLPKKMAPGMTALEAVDIGGNIVVGGMALAGGPAVIAVPIILGLKKLAAWVDSGIEPPNPDLLVMKTKVDHMRTAFKDTTEHLGKQILRLMEKAKDLNGVAANIEVTEAISSMLLSPVWYPPPAHVTRNPGLAGAIEMRMWFQYTDKIMKLPPAVPAGIGMVDFGPMWNRMQKKALPPGVEYIKFPSFNKWVIKPKGDQYSAFKKLHDFGKKNRSLAISHTYPKQVQDYLSHASLRFRNDVGSFPSTGKFRMDDFLPPSNLTWASVAI
ncbi:MAG TPA: hypothetical protein PKD26_09930 [Pyrinomonadaceae bacterium]|nr:hypothetical protein [Pyrinomonadaceae bacterium]